ncbi:hypothetical protein AVEN_66891-1 [Araneus ventricosus]|uniref:Uncharacterized protein n=1 Tax=Araneus ventricosus TaxID=182803 RepID=A0A4Y2NEL2_ARAVE|nr:hypothetical protein AVEN_66891-1 [Araneus ventricosus]
MHRPKLGKPFGAIYSRPLANAKRWCMPTYRRRRERCRPNDVNIGGRCLAVAWPMMFCSLGHYEVYELEVSLSLSPSPLNVLQHLRWSSEKDAGLHEKVHDTDLLILPYAHIHRKLKTSRKTYILP